jgi:hypothetical protein
MSSTPPEDMGWGPVWPCVVCDSGGPRVGKHFLDINSLLNLEHGILYFWMLALVFYWDPEDEEWMTGWALFILSCLAVLWEYVVHHPAWRLAFHPNHPGDFDETIINCLGAIFATDVGYLVCVRIGATPSVVLFLALEAIVALRTGECTTISVLTRGMGLSDPRLSAFMASRSDHYDDVPARRGDDLRGDDLEGARGEKGLLAKPAADATTATGPMLDLGPHDDGL